MIRRRRGTVYHVQHACGHLTAHDRAPQGIPLPVELLAAHRRNAAGLLCPACQAQQHTQPQPSFTLWADQGKG